MLTAWTTRMSVTTGTEAAGAGAFLTGDGGPAAFAVTGAGAGGADDVAGDAARWAMAFAFDMRDGSRLPVLGGLLAGLKELILLALVVDGGIALSEKLRAAFDSVDVGSGAITAGAWLGPSWRRDKAICRLATLMLFLRAPLLLVGLTERSGAVNAPVGCASGAQIASRCCCWGEIHCRIMSIIVGSNCLDGSKADTKRIRGPLDLWFALCTTTEKRSAASCCLPVRVGRRC
jgi:hypothetical protein